MIADAHQVLWMYMSTGKKGMIMKIKSVTVQGMKNVINETYEFSDINYIQGPNGSGKSTILNAIQYALLGYIPGNDKTNAGISSFMNDDIMKVIVELKTDDNETIIVTRSIFKSGRGYRQEIDVDPKAVDINEILGNCKLPIFDWQEFENLTANKSKEWFVSFLPNQSDSIDWETCLTANIPPDTSVEESFVSSYISKFSKLQGDDNISILSQANKILREDLNYNKARLIETTDSLSFVVKNGITYRSSKNLDDLNSELHEVSTKCSDCESQIQSILISIESYNNSIKLLESMKSGLLDDSKRSEITSKLQSLESSKSTFELTCSQYEHDIAELEAEYESKNFEDSLLELKTELAQSAKILESDGSCPYTSVPCDEIMNIKIQQSSKVKDCQSQIDSIKNESGLYKERIQSIRVSKAKASKELDDINQTILSYNHALQIDENTRHQIESTHIDDFDIDEANSKYEDLKANLQKLQAEKSDIEESIKHMEIIESFKKQVHDLKEKKKSIENEIQVLKSWIKLTGENGLQTTMSKSVFEQFETVFNTYIHYVFDSNTDAKFYVDTKSNSFSFGITRNGIYIPYKLLSTGEKTCYRTSLMLYILEQSNSQLRLILIDDIFDHLDLERFTTTLNCIQEHRDDVQIIIVSVVDCEMDNINVIQL